MAGDLPPVGDALAELLTVLQVVGGMAVAAGASVGQGEVHHRSQGDGGGQGMGLDPLVLFSSGGTTLPRLGLAWRAKAWHGGES